MLKIANRVGLFGTRGHIRNIHTAEARRMIEQGQAEPTTTTGTVRALTVIGSLSSEQSKPASALTLRNYAGWKPTYREPLRASAGEITAYTTTLKRIDSRDAHLYRLSITDCLTA